MAIPSEFRKRWIEIDGREQVIQTLAKEFRIHRRTVERRIAKLKAEELEGPADNRKEAQQKKKQYLQAPSHLEQSWIDKAGETPVYKQLAERVAWLLDAEDDHPKRQHIEDAIGRLRKRMAEIKGKPDWLTFEIPGRFLAAVPKWWRD